MSCSLNSLKGVIIWEILWGIILRVILVDTYAMSLHNGSHTHIDPLRATAGYEGPISRFHICQGGGEGFNNPQP